MLLRSLSKGKGRWSLRGRTRAKDTQHDEMPADAATMVKTHNSPYMHHPYNQTEISTSILRAMPAISKARRKSNERLSGRWEDSGLGAMCDNLFEPSKRLSLRLDFEHEIKTTPVYPMQPIASSPRDSHQQNSPTTTFALPPQSPKSRHSKSSSGKRVLRNIPIVNGGFWNTCMRSVPKIKFVRKFEESDD